MTSNRDSFFRSNAYGAIGLLSIALVIVGITYWQTRLPDQEPLPVQRVREHDRLEKPAPPADNYVGGDACRRCHQVIWDRYQSHPMARSASTTREATVLEDFDQHPSFTVSSLLGEIEYRVERHDERQFHRESLTNPASAPTYDQREPIEYVIGSGRHGRSYVLVKGECLFMSPLTWYSEESRWDLSPNYSPGQNPRFERRILHSCLGCHTDRIAINRDEPDRFSTPAILEAKISCERCHGPGAEHIVFHDRRASSAATNPTEIDPITNPSKLDDERRESICWQCHFSAEERIPRYGRLDSDFRPGMNFDDIWVAFTRGSRFDENGATRVVSHVEQSRASSCSRHSQGKFGCVSCHDPHFAPIPAEKDSYYREKCLVCHATHGCALPITERTETTGSDSCVACHMPPTSLRGVPHTSRTDHRVLRRPQQSDSSSADAPLSIFRSFGRQLPQIEQDRAWGLVLAKLAYLRTDPEIARAAEQKLSLIQPSIPDDLKVLEWLGVCEQILGRAESARGHWQEILKDNPNHEEALRRLADQAISESNFPVAQKMLKRYVEVNPWQSQYHARLASIQGELGNLDETIRCAQESLKVNPSQTTAHRLLYEAYRRLGNQHEREVHQKLLQRLTTP